MRESEKNIVKDCLQWIFSIKKSPSRTHKIVKLCGIKLSICIENKKIRKLKIKSAQRHYRNHIKKLRTEIKHRKIRILFLVNDNSKWKTQSLYDLMKKSEEFEPVIALNIADWQWQLDLVDRSKIIEQNRNFFEQRGMSYILAYDETSGEAISLDTFQPDIVFYQQPYIYNKTHEPLTVSKYALTYYIPYYIPNYWIPHLYWWKSFHRHLFRYYQPSQEWADSLNMYIKDNIHNIIGIGHTMLDEFYLKKNEVHSSNYVIYAPHWSIKHKKNKQEENYSTFIHNHKEILEYAKTHSEFNWVFKPHPTLKHTLIKTEIMTEEEVNNYYNEWAMIGTGCYDSNYVDIFLNSKALITDCGSFLIEYFVTGKPLIHLISKDCIPKTPKFIQKIFDSFYKVHNNKELLETLDNILVKNNDYLRKNRLAILEEQTWLNTYAAENILEDIRSIMNAKN